MFYSSNYHYITVFRIIFPRGLNKTGSWQFIITQFLRRFEHSLNLDSTRSHYTHLLSPISPFLPHVIRLLCGSQKFDSDLRFPQPPLASIIRLSCRLLSLCPTSSPSSFSFLLVCHSCWWWEALFLRAFTPRRPLPGFWQTLIRDDAAVAKPYKLFQE